MTESVFVTAIETLMGVTCRFKVIKNTIAEKAAEGTRSEALLKAFAENPKRVLTRERLLDLAEARDREAFDRAIDVRITRIRKKIEPDPTRPSVIRTVRGAGYLFSPDGAEPG